MNGKKKVFFCPRSGYNGGLPAGTDPPAPAHRCHLRNLTVAGSRLRERAGNRNEHNHPQP